MRKQVKPECVDCGNEFELGWFCLDGKPRCDKCFKKYWDPNLLDKIKKLFGV